MTAKMGSIVLPSSAQVDEYFKKTNENVKNGTADYECTICKKSFPERARKNMQPLKKHLQQHNVTIPEASKSENVHCGVVAITELWKAGGDLKEANYPDLKTFLRFHGIAFNPFAGKYAAGIKATEFLAGMATQNSIEKSTCSGEQGKPNKQVQIKKETEHVKRKAVTPDGDDHTTTENRSCKRNKKKSASILV